jgi:hypothetical protein
VVPDAKYRGMCRTKLSGARLSDMANLSWARNAVLEAAAREIEWEARQAENTPTNSQQNRVDFPVTTPPMRSPDPLATPLAPCPENEASEPAASQTALSSVAA